MMTEELLLRGRVYTSIINSLVYVLVPTVCAFLVWCATPKIGRGTESYRSIINDYQNILLYHIR